MLFSRPLWGRGLKFLVSIWLLLSYVSGCPNSCWGRHEGAQPNLSAMPNEQRPPNFFSPFSLDPISRLPGRLKLGCHLVLLFLSFWSISTSPTNCTTLKTGDGGAHSISTAAILFSVSIPLRHHNHNAIREERIGAGVWLSAPPRTPPPFLEACLLDSGGLYLNQCSVGMYNILSAIFIYRPSLINLPHFIN